MKQVLKTIGLAGLGGALVLTIYINFFQEPRQVVIQQQGQNIPAVQTSAGSNLEVASFAEAAELSVNGVVHVNVAVERRRSQWEEFFYGQGKPQIVQGSGSGVIISQNGYIVTNNHVINGAKTINVTLNDNRKFDAELIGADPTTDIALLKIDADDLDAIEFANSDDVRLGEWVLAVGNPFNLTSTVTAGIISAKGRNINIINTNSAIESFIQTDAAVNPGNSGGALVNTRGDLIGINTAISTHTGSFEGYSFAVPSNIVKKVVDDLMTFGAVQRAFLGVNIVDVTAELAKEQGLDITSGVYVVDVVDDGAAKDAGLKRGDVIINIDGNEVTKSAELLEQIGRKRPGDVAKVIVNRSSKSKSFDVTLRNQRGTTKLYNKDEMTSQGLLGAQIEALSADQKRELGLRYGFVVTDPGNGKLKQAGVPKGFIIIKVNNELISSAEEMEKLLKNLGQGDGVLIQGYHPNGKPDYFAFGM